MKICDNFHTIKKLNILSGVVSADTDVVADDVDGALVAGNPDVTISTQSRN